jgi:hypothetical protein
MQYAKHKKFKVVLYRCCTVRGGKQNLQFNYKLNVSKKVSIMFRWGSQRCVVLLTNSALVYEPKCES